MVKCQSILLVEMQLDSETTNEFMLIKINKKAKGVSKICTAIPGAIGFCL